VLLYFGALILPAWAFILAPNYRILLVAFLSTIPLHLIIKGFDFGALEFSDLLINRNYFVRAAWAIFIGSLIFSISLFLYKTRYKKFNTFFHSETSQITKIGLGLLASLVLLHLIFIKPVGINISTF